MARLSPVDRRLMPFDKDTGRKPSPTAAVGRASGLQISWWFVVALLVVAALAAFAFVFSPVWGYSGQALPVSLQSPLRANYSIDVQLVAHAPLEMKIIAEALLDRYQPGMAGTSGEPQSQLATVVNSLLTSVPTVTPTPTLGITSKPGEATFTVVPDAVGTLTFLPETETPSAVPSVVLTNTPEVTLTTTSTTTHTVTETAFVPSATFRPIITIVATTAVPTRTPTRTPTPKPPATATVTPIPSSTNTLVPTNTATEEAYPPPPLSTSTVTTDTPIPPYP
jgi:hypothetical protein